MNYKIISNGVLRLDDGANIPDDPLNQDWIAYQAWLSQGNTPVAADPLPNPVAQDLQSRRWELYPSIQDQLDALYQARQGDPTGLAAIDSTITAANSQIAS